MLVVLYLWLVVLSTSLCVIAFLLVTCGDLRTFKEKYAPHRPRRSPLPIVTRHGDIVNSLEDLDVQLEVLKSQLLDKQRLLEESKGKVTAASTNLQRLHESSCDVKRYYIKLRAEIAKSDRDCQDLQRQIEEYRRTQARLRDDVNANIKFYNTLIHDVENNSCTRQEVEMLAKLPIEEAAFMLPLTQ